MKRKIALIATCAMVVLSLAACSKTNKDVNKNNDNSTTNGQTKLVMAWWGNQTRNERTQEVLDMYSEKNTSVVFDGQFAEWADYWNKLATSSAGHSLPDIVQMDYKYISQYVSNDLLVDLKPYIDQGTLNVDNLDPGIIDAATVDGKIYAICNGVNAPALLYNKTLLDENGIEVKDNMTMAEFIDLCREVYEKTGYKTNIAYNNGENFIEYFLRGKGIQFFDGNKFGTDSAEAFADFFKLYENGIKEEWHLEPSVFAERTIGSVEQDPLVYGSNPSSMSWCTFNYSNQLTAVQNAAPEKMEIGITTWPSEDPKASNYLKPSQFFSVTVDSKAPEEAAKFIDYVTNSVECNEVLLGERGVPASSEIASAIAPKLDADYTKVVDFINNVVTPNCSTLNPPAPDGASEVYDLINQLEEKVCYGKMTAEEAGEELLLKGNEMLGRR